MPKPDFTVSVAPGDTVQFSVNIKVEDATPGPSPAWAFQPGDRVRVLTACYGRLYGRMKEGTVHDVSDHRGIWVMMDSHVTNPVALCFRACDLELITVSDRPFPFKVGDWVKLNEGGLCYRVGEVQWRENQWRWRQNGADSWSPCEGYHAVAHDLDKGHAEASRRETP